MDTGNNPSDFPTETNQPDVVPEIQPALENKTINPPEPQIIKSIPPPAAPKKHGKGLSFWLSILFGFLLLVSFGVNVMMLIVIGSQSMNIEPSSVSVPSMGNERFVEGDKNSRNKVLLIPVNGIIMEGQSNSSFYEKNMVKDIMDEFERAGDDKSIKAIVMSINSPGGGVTDCDGIYKKIMEFKEKRPDVPIVVSMQDVAASGGYYISAPATKIFAQPTTITGSIGVIMEFVNFQELFNKIGLQQMTFKSGKLKDIGSATREMTKEEKDILNNLVLEMSSRFIQIVKDGRKLNEEQLKIVSDARVFTASQAVKVGLVDQIGYLSDAYDSAKKLASLSDAKLVRYKKQFNFFDYLEETSKDLKPESEVGKIKEIVPLTPRMMYLWSI